jgi:hypothetical protein
MSGKPSTSKLIMEVDLNSKSITIPLLPTLPITNAVRILSTMKLKLERLTSLLTARIDLQILMSKLQSDLRGIGVLEAVLKMWTLM